MDGDGALFPNVAQPMPPVPNRIPPASQPWGSSLTRAETNTCGYVL
ncbi:hypothetical protein Mnod_3236 [Methylobacterium nodulans ORS 2060]|uniref:Uncharacterized protein n=1 Tax=Methylobacterium nodulans (strain LMG 21967 / CNCM I-2342 / ORS 2060) TaxID=460265 RepID=B8IKX2_METNO|nr:hypothetical protein Mnod_3236 [Methylobacterium nodulans ORS 2060]